jgi:hypothetical protein
LNFFTVHGFHIVQRDVRLGASANTIHRVGSAVRRAIGGRILDRINRLQPPHVHQIHVEIVAQRERVGGRATGINARVGIIIMSAITWCGIRGDKSGGEVPEAGVVLHLGEAIQHVLIVAARVQIVYSHHPFCKKIEYFYIVSYSF